VASSTLPSGSDVVSQATIGELLRSGTQRLRDSGSESARLDAELLLGQVLRLDRASLLAHPELPVGPGQAAAFETGVDQRVSGEPVAYIRGIKEFYGIVLTVDPRALIPRPETELLVDLGLERVRAALTAAPRGADSPPLRIWDVGTGSGAICIALAVECRRRGYGADIRFAATDISADALALATENAVSHGVADQIDFAQADLLQLPDVPPVDLLLANLPYIPTAAVPELPVAASFEPRIALDGGPDGLAVIRRLLAELPAVLAPMGTGLLEIGADKTEAFSDAAAEALPGWSVVIHPDLSGDPRVAELHAA
jgi:release factor glutamine methyltransferase